MSDTPLRGKKIGIIVESEFIPAEIATYRERFSAYGAEVHLMSRLWDQPSLTFTSDVEEPDETPQTLEVNLDLAEVELEDYAALIMAANYTSCRLRWLDDGDGAVTGDGGTEGGGPGARSGRLGDRRGEGAAVAAAVGGPRPQAR